jgi:hypothetical protein
MYMGYKTFLLMPDVDKQNIKAIILAEAQLIKKVTELQLLKEERDVYPTAREIESIDANLNFLPQNLQLFLRKKLLHRLH